MTYKALNINSNQFGKNTLAKSYQSVSNDSRAISVNVADLVDNDETAAFKKHLRWYFANKVFIDKDNRYFLIQDIDIIKTNDSSYYWDRTLGIKFITNTRNYFFVKINLDRKQTLVQVYDEVLDHIYSQIRVKSKADLAEAEKVLFMDVI